MHYFNKVTGKIKAKNPDNNTDYVEFEFNHTYNGYYKYDKDSDSILIDEDAYNEAQTQSEYQTEYNWAKCELTNCEALYNKARISSAGDVTCDQVDAYMSALRNYATVDDGVYSLRDPKSYYEINGVKYCVAIDGDTNRPISCCDGGVTKKALTLAQTKVQKINELTLQCEQSIIGGISSNALGTAHNYDTRVVDQNNLIASLAKSQIEDSAMVRCNDPTGQEGFIERFHTEAQIKQVLADFSTHRELNSEKLSSKIALVNSATTISAVNEIHW